MLVRIWENKHHTLLAWLKASKPFRATLWQQLLNLFKIHTFGPAQFSTFGLQHADTFSKAGKIINALRRCIAYGKKKLKWSEYSIRDLRYNNILYTFFFNSSFLLVICFKYNILCTTFWKQEPYVYTHIHTRKNFYVLLEKSRLHKKMCSWFISVYMHIHRKTLKRCINTSKQLLLRK